MERTVRRTVLCLCLGAALASATSLQADTSDCRVLSPIVPISENASSPTQDIISVTVSETIVDVDVSVDIQHDYIDDVRLDISSPFGTSVRLHDQSGSADFIITTFDDQGVPNGTIDFDSGCSMQPSGPGALADFAGQDTAGDWTLSVVDTFSGGATGFLREWCLFTYDTAVSAAVLTVDDLLCTSVGGTGVVDLQWTNTQTYDSINIYLSGGIIDTIPGTSTSYSTTPLLVGTAAEFLVEPVVAGTTPCEATSCATTPQQAPADTVVCSVPGAVVSNTLPPTVDTITVTDTYSLADLQVQVDVTHPFLGDINVDLAHGATSVRLHDGVGGAGTRIQAIFWDLGVPNGQVPYDCGCPLAPSGPGMLSDFFGLDVQGDWTLTVDDFWPGPANFGELRSWCLRGYETGSVNQLDCTTTSGSTIAELTWSNPQSFDEIRVYASGILEATLPGSATAYTSISQPVPSTVDFCLEPVLGGTPLAQNCCVAEFAVDPVEVLGCSSVTGSGVATVEWTNPFAYDEIRVYVNSNLESVLPGTATTYDTLPVGAGALPTTASICLEGVQNGAVAAQSCCNEPLSDVVDYQACRTPGVPVNLQVSPVTDILIVPNPLLIGEAEVLVDISHTFVGDLVVDLTGPNGSNVVLHGEQGNDTDDLKVVYRDSGGPNTIPYDCGCEMQPFGPGTMADFANIPALGVWVLQIEDTFNGNTGTLNEWCLRFRAGCQLAPPDQLVTASDGTDVSLSWNNNATYDTIEVLRDGVGVGSLAGGATSYVDLGPPPGVHEYEILAVSTSLACGNSSMPASAGTGITDLIYRGDVGGNVDSPDEIALQLFGLGRVPMIIDSFDADSIATVGPPEVIWITLGTFPNESSLSAAESTLLAELHTGDVGLDGTVENTPIPVYLESADFWAYDPPTTFQDYDGVENFSFGNLENGNDSLMLLDGKNTGLGLDLFSLDAPYQQDGSGNDYTDRLVPCDVNPDLGGAQAAVTWSGDEFGNVYDVGVYYASTIAPVLVQSWEFGGYGGDRGLLMDEYVQALTSNLPPPPTEQFIRGDSNDDGSVNIADVIFFLNSLFTPGSATPGCRRTGDTNDDESLNVADAIFILNSLFVPNSDPVPPPNTMTGCGIDPTLGSIDCLDYDSCP